MKKIWGFTGALLASLLLTGCLPLEPQPSNETSVTTPTATTTQSESPPVQENEEAEGTEREPTDDENPKLGEEVEKALLEANVVDSFEELGSSSPGFAITEIEPLNSTTIRVHVQDTLDDADAENTARWVTQMSCQQVPDATTIVIRDVSGVDRNFYSSRINLIPECQ